MSLEEVASGAWAGFVGTVLGYPLDVAKSRMQTGKTGVPVAAYGRAGTTATQASFGRTFVSMVRAEGVSGMYRGLGPPVCMMMLMNSMNFTAFGAIKDSFVGRREVGWGTTHGCVEWRVVAAAAAVGPLCAVISTPFELVKLQLQLDSVGGQRKYLNALDAAKQLFRRYGPRIFYLGHGVNTARECVFHGIFFATYEHINHGLHREVGLSKSFSLFAAGGIAGAFAWAGNLPLDCIKSGVQGQCLGDGGWNGQRARVGVAEAARKVMARGGISGFFSGATPSIMRAFVVSGSRFAAFSSGMAVFEGLRQHKTSSSLVEAATGSEVGIGDVDRDL